MDNERVRFYTRYIEPLDSSTNRALARQIPEEDAMEIRDEKGRTRQVFRIAREQLSVFRNSKIQEGFLFNVLMQEGNGKIREVPPLAMANRRKRNARFSRQAQIAM
jgi:hypothetical protein